MKRKAFILGGGVAGLSAGLNLTRTDAFDVCLLEKADRVGGLATSFKRGQTIFDFGPHGFHSREEHVITFFKELLKDNYYAHDKNVAIKFRGEIYPYPLNPLQAMRKMPITISLKAGLSYMWNELTNHHRLDQLRTAEEFFVRNYGWELYRIFFEGYTEKVWGIHPRELSAQFMRNRVPSAGLIHMIRYVLTGRDVKVKKTTEITFKISFYYPKQGSIQFCQAMADGIRENNGRVTLVATVNRVEIKNNRVVAISWHENGQEKYEPCDAAVSTLPIGDLFEIMDPKPSPDLLASAKQLKFRPILIVCLWINKPSIFPYQTVYYTNRLFNRLAQMNSYSVDLSPPGTCAVTAELTCGMSEETWQRNDRVTIERVIKDMEEEGLIEAKDVLDAFILRHPHGYPVYQIGYEHHLRRLLEAVHNIENLYVSGRQGMFNYAQMHYGISSGFQIANRLKNNEPKPALPQTLTEELPFA